MLGGGGTLRRYEEGKANYLLTKRLWQNSGHVDITQSRDIGESRTQHRRIFAILKSSYSKHYVKKRAGLLPCSPETHMGWARLFFERWEEPAHSAETKNT